MLTLIYATLLLAAIVAPLPLILLTERNHKRKALRSFLNLFQELGHKSGLSFSSQSVLNGTIIGLDGIQRKVLVMEQVDDIGIRSTQIDLADVTRCKLVQEQASATPTPQLRKQNAQGTVLLHFNLNSGAEASVIFFDPGRHRLEDLQELAQKARHWETMLNKLLTPAPKQTSLSE